MNLLYPYFKDLILRERLVLPKDVIYVAYSGGKDSTALLLLLKTLAKDLSFHLKAIYFNHQIRKDYLEEENWVDNFCSQQEIPLIKGRGNVLDYAKKKKLNLEQAASTLRYKFFKTTIKNLPNSKIATAHTKTDLAETFLIKLFRGSGIQGLSAIFTRKDKNIIRPLITFSQLDVELYLKDNDLNFYQDSTNLKTSLLRNKIRIKLFPLIKEISPRIEEHILITVNILQKEFGFFTRLARDFLKTEIILNCILPTTQLIKKDRALQRHIIREYIRKIKGDLLNIGYNHIEDVLNNIEKSKGLSLPNLELVLKKDYLFPLDFIIKDYYVKVENISKTKSIKLQEINKEIFFRKSNGFKKPLNNQSICMPLSELQVPLIIRSPKKGDKYNKINSKFSLSVLEMIRENGFPHKLRNLCPVFLVDDKDFLWCYRSPIANRYKHKSSQINSPHISITLNDI